MILYRLCRAIYAEDLSGKGAEKSGGRWNTKGHAVVYTSSSRALCVAEIAVHFPIGILPDGFVLSTIFVDDDSSMEHIAANELPSNWNLYPPTLATQTIGNQFIIQSKSLILRVPSAVVQGDYNYLLNPNHPQFKKVKIVSTEIFTFDDRLFTKLQQG